MIRDWTDPDVYRVFTRRQTVGLRLLAVVVSVGCIVLAICTTGGWQ